MTTQVCSVRRESFLMEAASMRWPEGIRQANLLLTTRTMSKLEKMWGGGGMVARWLRGYVLALQVKL